MLTRATAPSISETFSLSPARTDLIRSVPIMAGAPLRFPLGLLLQSIGRKNATLVKIALIAVAMLFGSDGFLPQQRDGGWRTDRPGDAALEGQQQRLSGLEAVRRLTRHGLAQQMAQPDRHTGPLARRRRRSGLCARAHPLAQPGLVGQQGALLRVVGPRGGARSWAPADAGYRARIW